MSVPGASALEPTYIQTGRVRRAPTKRTRRSTLDSSHSEAVTQPRSDAVARRQLQPLVVLVQRQLHEAVGVHLFQHPRRQPGTDEHRAVAAVGMPTAAT